jgi:hypothetical protein
LDFDDEDPQPPHPEIGLVYHYEIGTHAGCLPHHVRIISGALPPGLKLSQLNDHTALVDGIATDSGTFSAWMAVTDCDNKSAETLFTFDFERECRAATRSNGSVTPFGCLLDILRVMIQATNDDEVFEAARDVEFALVQKSEIACSQEVFILITGKMCIESVSSGFRLVPISAGDALSGNPNLANFARYALSKCLSVNYEHLLLGCWNAATDECPARRAIAV